MPDYKSMYLKLFNKVTDALRILQEAQQQGEDAYVENEDKSIILLPEDSEGEKEN